MQSSFHLERVSLILLLGCNLKCKNCCVQAPYYKHKYYPDLEFIKYEIDKLFRIADTINYFSVEGGETLLRDDLADILNHLTEYNAQIGVEVPIITNGTILPRKDVLDAAKLLGDKIHFIIDDYGSLSSKAQEICEILKYEGIRHLLRNYNDDPYYSGWVDLYGDYSLKRNMKEAERLFSKCAWAQKLKGVMEIIGGLIYFCPASRVYEELGSAVLNDEVIDFLDENISLEEIRTKITNLFSKKAMSACRYCNGIHDESERYKPAVQLNENEPGGIRFFHKYRENI